MKILIIRFSSIGDIVLTSPVIRCLKNQLGAELHYVTKSAYASLLDNNPHLDKIHLLQEDLNTLARRLKAEKFDFVVDLHNNLRSGILKRKLGIRSITFKKLNLEKAMMVWFKWNLLPEKHIVDRYFDALKEWKVENDQEGLEIFLNKDVPEYWCTMSEKLNNNAKNIVLALGGTYATKQVPKEKWKEIIRYSEGNLILIGGKEDMETAAWLEKNTGKQVFNTTGMLDLMGSSYLLSLADLVISGDTGMMHIAAALMKPVVSIWGNTIPEFGMYPYYGNHNVDHFNMEVRGLSCRPCSKLGKSSCPKKHFKCMVDQDIQMIVKNMEFILRS